MNKHLLSLSAALAALVLAAACDPAPNPDPEPEPEPEAKTIAELAAETPELSTLVTALDAAGLVETFNGDDELTVFAPTNAAFEALPAGALDALLADPEGALTDVLTFHAAAGATFSADLEDGQSIPTVQGEALTVTVNEDGVFVNGIAVETADIEASNGVIHIIGGVLLPPEPAPQTIAEIAAGDEDLSTLVAALTAADLVDTLNGDGPFTVFAPTNAAFDALPAGTVDALLADVPRLTKVLTHHVVEGSLDADAVLAEDSLTSLFGQALAIDPANVTIAGANISITNIEASNGIVHVIDAVMVPKTIAELAAEDADLSTLVTALTAANLVDTFNGDDLFTVFAPTNAAFAALPAGALDALVADVPQLTKVLTYHVAEGELDADAVLAASEIDTLFGQPAAIDATNVTIDGAPISVTNIPALNGVIHVIDAVMSPPTIAEVAAADANLSTLVTALGAANLVDTFNGEGPFTVFAPTNAAFDALPAGTLDALINDIPQLTKVLTYHVATEELDATAVTGAAAVDTLFGQPAAVDTSSGATIDGAPISITNVPAANGVIHVIDAVMIPPTVMEVVRASEVHTTLEVAIDTAGIAGVLNDTADITLFAPNDEAFADVDPTALSDLLADVPALTEVLQYHVSGAELTAEEVLQQTSIETLQGQSVTVSTNQGGVLIDGALVVQADVPAFNGVIHVLRAVLFP